MKLSFKKYRFGVVLAACWLLLSGPVLAQLPQCDRIYMDELDGLSYNNLLKIWNYDPTLPLSGTNPALNTIILPSGSNGLTVSEVLGSGSPTLTFYTVVNNQYWFYNPTTSTWNNSGHNTGNSAAVNIAAGGGFIYNLVGGTGQVYKYNGTGNGTLLVTVPNQSGEGPYDLLADCEGNFYVLNGSGNIGSRSMRKYSPAGVLLQTWPVIAASNYNPSGGFGIVGGDIYTDQVDFFSGETRIATGTVGPTQVNITGQTGLLPYNVNSTWGNTPGDFGTCASAITIQPSITISASQNGVCDGSPITFTSTITGGGTAPTYQWFVNGAIVPGATSTTYTYIPQNGDIVTAQMISNAACLSNPLAISNPVNVIVYPHGVFNISASICNSGYYVFSNGDTLTTSGTYTDSLISNAGCDSIVVLDLTVVPPLPAPGVNNVRVCQGSGNVTLTATGQNLTWYDAPTGGSVLPNPVSVSTANPGVSTYYVSQTVGGCESPRAAMTVTVVLTPTNMLSGPGMICKADTLWVGYNGNGTTDMDYSWTVAPAAVDWSQAVGIGPAGYHFTQEGSYIVSLVVTNEQCSTTATLPVTVTEPPTPFFALPEHGCIGLRQNLVYQFDSDPALTYNWDFDGGTPVSGDQGQPVAVVYGQPGVYHLSLQTAENGCFSPIWRDSIQIHDYPHAEIVTNPGILCEGDTVRFSAMPAVERSKYYWEPLDWLVWPVDPYTALIEVPRSGDIVLTVISQYGCSATDTLPVRAEMCCNMEMPTAFTPNGDGRNDVFRPVVVGQQTVGQFRIWNRWGREVFATTDKNQGWNGTLKGEPQEMGTYYYFLEYFCSDGSRHTKKGDVTLVR